MSRVKTLQSLFKRYRRPGDIVFAWAVLILSVFLLSQLLDQTAYKPGGKLFAQPRFWPAVSLIGMTFKEASGNCELRIPSTSRASARTITSTV